MALAALTNQLPHQGLDIVADFGEKVYSPIDGTITFDNVPYGTEFDGYYRGLEIEGTGKWIGYNIKIFYVDRSPSSRQEVSAGDEIGTTQLLDLAYSKGITNHVHVEVRYFGTLKDPLEIWKMSF